MLQLASASDDFKKVQKKSIGPDDPSAWLRLRWAIVAGFAAALPLVVHDEYHYRISRIDTDKMAARIRLELVSDLSNASVSSATSEIQKERFDQIREMLEENPQVTQALIKRLLDRDFARQASVSDGR